MTTYETDRLTFKPSLDDMSVWWALDDDNVEYCVQPSVYDPDQWSAHMQKRVAYNSVSENIGTFYDFEDACWACDEANPIDFGF